MRCYKQILDGYLFAVGKGAKGGEEITAEEYNEILSILRNRPTAPEGYGYRLTESLEWELYELPAEEETDDEISAEEALEIITGGTV